MPLIEGLGDEVTLVLGGFLLCVVLMLAWFSTHTADIPLLREVGVIVVELSQRRSRTQNTAVEERPGREDSSLLEQESISSGSERLIARVDNNPNEASDAALRELPVWETNNIATDNVEQTQSFPPSDESSGAVPDSAIADQHALKKEHLQSGHKSVNQIENEVRDSEECVPKASFVVDDHKGFNFTGGSDNLSEEEVRQRRVQYFQTSKTGQSVGGSSEAQAEPNNYKSSSLSMTLDSDNTRQSNGDSIQSSCLSAVVTERAPEPTEGASKNLLTTSLLTSALAQESASGTSVFSQDISDNQASTTQGESSDSRIRVKLKYMNETQRLVYASPLDTIGDFRRTHFQTELQDNKWVRFIYNGQDLRDDDKTLQACNIGDNCTMHCLITAQVRPANSRDVAAEEYEDSFMGSLMYPLFTVIILIVWYFRFTYRQYFSAMTTVCLIGISFLLALSYISSLRATERTPTPQQRATPPPVAAAGGGGAREAHPHAD